MLAERSKTLLKLLILSRVLDRSANIIWRYILKDVTPVIDSRRKYEKLAFVAHVLQNTQNLVISSCCFAEDVFEMYEDLQRTCTAVVLLIKPFFWWLSRCRCRRGLANSISLEPYINKLCLNLREH